MGNWEMHFVSQVAAQPHSHLARARMLCAIMHDHVVAFDCPIETLAALINGPIVCLLHVLDQIVIRAQFGATVAAFAELCVMLALFIGHFVVAGRLDGAHQVDVLLQVLAHGCRLVRAEHAFRVHALEQAVLHDRIHRDLLLAANPGHHVRRVVSVDGRIKFRDFQHCIALCFGFVARLVARCKLEISLDYLRQRKMGIIRKMLFSCDLIAMSVRATSAGTRICVTYINPADLVHLRECPAFHRH